MSFPLFNDEEVQRLKAACATRIRIVPSVEMNASGPVMAGDALLTIPAGALQPGNRLSVSVATASTPTCPVITGYVDTPLPEGMSWHAIDEVNAEKMAADGRLWRKGVEVNAPEAAALLAPSDTTHETLTTDEPMDLLELQRRCNASTARLADGSATFAHIRAQRAQADLVASIRSEWDNLPDAEPEGIVPRPC
jgi:hypothetical protein